MTLIWTRHCERSEAIHSRARDALDCFAALAMTDWVSPMSSCFSVLRPGHGSITEASAQFSKPSRSGQDFRYAHRTILA